MPGRDGTGPAGRGNNDLTGRGKMKGCLRMGGQSTGMRRGQGMGQGQRQGMGKRQGFGFGQGYGNNTCNGNQQQQRTRLNNE